MDFLLNSSITNTTVFCGGHFVYLLTEDNFLYSCGDNGYGTLGLSDNKDRNSFTRVDTLFLTSRIKNVFCGGNFIYLLTEDNSLYSCGDNRSGCLGLSDNEDRNSFTRVDTSFLTSRIKNVFCGELFVYLLTEDNLLYIRGYNLYGYLGLCDNKCRNSFTRVDTSFLNSRIKNIFCGNDFVYLLTEDNSLYTRGNNSYGNLGLSDNQNRISFIRVDTFFLTSRIKNIFCGEWFVYLITEDNSLYSCGDNNYGTLGLSDNEDRNSFTRVDTFFLTSRIKNVFCGGTFVYLLTEDNSLYSCGNNIYGSLGLSDNEDRNSFTRVDTTSRIKNVFSGEYFVYLITEDNFLYSCGYNNFGALGLSDNKNRNIFTKLRI